MAGSDQKWVAIASQFPAGLDTETDPLELEDGFTPDGYGFDIDYPGRLAAASSVGLGNNFIAKTFTIGADTWSWFYRRLWLIDSANLDYNAPEYQDSVLPQDIGSLSFDEDINSLITFFPFAGSAMFVAKSTGGYAVANAASLGGDFQHGDIEEAMAVTTDGYALPLDDIAYASNSNGLMAWDGGEIAEVTQRARSSLSYFQNRSLRIDRQKRRVIGNDGSTTTFIYDVGLQKLFVYNDPVDFRFTSRSMSDPTGRPITIRKLAFLYENTTGADGRIHYQVKRDEGWEDVENTLLADRETVRRHKIVPLRRALASRQFAVRLTSLPSHIHIRAIYVLGENISAEESWSE